MDRRIVCLAIVVGAVAACGTAPLTRPPAAALDVVGPLQNVSEFESRTQYSLVDGTVWARPNDRFRVLYDMPGSNTLFVSGHDSQGEYVLLVGDQDGLPEGCVYALRYGGRDWGDSIESQGVMWTKAEDFVGLDGKPLTSGADYPTNAGFCLDQQARVTSVYLAEPPEGSQAPAGSAAVP